MKTKMTIPHQYRLRIEVENLTDRQDKFLRGVIGLFVDGGAGVDALERGGAAIRMSPTTGKCTVVVDGEHERN